MTDIELLKLAARAAGFGAPGSGAVIWTESEYPRRSGKTGALWNYSGYMDTAELWNPLTDDGDALRLAAKLRINLHICESDAMTTAYAEGAIQGAAVDFMDDPYAATRRAIVRAAAEIGMTATPTDQGN